MSEDAPPVPRVVGLGASAGGLESLRGFFDAVQPGGSFAYVVVQHLSPNHRSMMAELLGRHTELPVVQAEDGVVVEADHVYLAPPGRELALAGRRLVVSRPPEGVRVHLPIDTLFRSLAAELSDRAVGIVLSGTGSDGTRGIRDIKAAGGLVLVEAPTNARFDGMPVSAIRTGLVDRVTEPDAMPQMLVNLLDDARARGVTGLAEPEGTEPDEPDFLHGAQLHRLLHLLRQRMGRDFRSYRPSTLGRRVQRRMQMRRVEAIDDYLDVLDEDATELGTLSRELLIRVTRFFRDPEVFEAVANEAIPTIVHEHDRDQQIRVWVPGCATGEEAYSLAILFREYLDAQYLPHEVKIFATDVDPDAVEVGSAGIYSESVTADLSPTRVERYFEPHGSAWRARRRLRDMVVFAPHDLMSDPPFIRLDLVSCRNLLIYLKNPAQRNVLANFSFALGGQGFLLLGKSESIGDSVDLFNTIDARHRLFQARRQVSARAAPLRSTPRRSLRLDRFEMPRVHSPGAVQRARDVLERGHLPASIVMDGANRLLHSFGNTDGLLRLPRGHASLDVLTLLVRPLSLAVSALLHRLDDPTLDTSPVSERAVPVGEGADPTLVDVTLYTLPDEGADTISHRLVVFEPVPQPSTTLPVELDALARTRIEQLEAQVARAQEARQAMIEELEASNEELQATNEELVASNEELQSANEELQSVNEELFTVNAQYQEKLAEMNELNTDMDHLLQSTRIGTLFLDPELAVRRFTQAVVGVVHLLDQDVGRPLAHIAHDLIDVDLVAIARKVLDTHDRVELRVQTRTGQRLLLRALAYHRSPGTIEGVVLTLVDVGEIQRAEQAYQDLFDGLADHVAVLDGHGRIVDVNRAWRAFGKENGLVRGKAGERTNYVEVCRAAVGGLNGEGAAEAADGIEAVLCGDRSMFVHEYPCHSQATKRWYRMRVVTLPSGEPGALVFHRDITELVRVRAIQEV